MLKWLFFLSFLIPAVSFSQMASIELRPRPVAQPATRDAVVEKWNQSQPGYNALSVQAREYLYWVNYCRRNPEAFWDSVIAPNLIVFPPLDGEEAASLRKDLNKSGPLPMLALNNSLIKTAQYHASDIATKNAAPSHTSTDGTDFSSRMKKAGIKYCANENISITSHGSLIAVLLLYLDIGLPSQGHRKTLLNPTLVETGIGSAPYGKEQFFLVQDLSCSQN
jgi:hypothetical protein